MSDSDGNQLTDAEVYDADVLTVQDLSHGADYWVTIEGPAEVSGTFDLAVVCTSDAPTTSPSADPSASPTTPAPSHPGELSCGSHDSGDYNGVPMDVLVQMPYDGDMTMDCSGSDFMVSNISAYDSDSNFIADCDPSASVLTVEDLTHGGHYLFTIEGTPEVSSGTYDIVIECSSNAPTSSPSLEPTVAPSSEPSSSPTLEPTLSPSEDPTTAPSSDPTTSPSADPTLEPSSDPTTSPSSDPTTAPSEDPSASPTTPAPTHPDELICGDHITGDYNGETMNVEVRAPYDSDMTLDLCGSDFGIGSITVYDSK